MAPVDFLWHLTGFLAPAAAVALLVALSAPLLLRGRSGSVSFGSVFALNFLAGAGALLLGLWWFGRDGKMLSYAALVLACATTQWVASRAWK